MTTEIYTLRQTITEYQRDLRDLRASHFELIDAEHALRAQVAALRAQVAALQAELSAVAAAVQGAATAADTEDCYPRVYTYLARYNRWQVRWAHNDRPLTVSMPGRNTQSPAEFASEADAIAHAQRFAYTIIPAPARKVKAASR